MVLILLKWGVVLAASLYVLTIAADYFIDSAEEIGLSLNISPFILGATLVALGTSLPELITCIFAVLEKTKVLINGQEEIVYNTEIVIGNVVGSNVSNIFLITGVAIFLSRTFVIPFKELKWDFAILAVSAILLTIFIWDGVFGFVEGIVCTIGMLGYTLFIVIFHKDRETELEDDDEDEEEETDEKPQFNIGNVVLFLFSGALIALAAKFTVDSIIEISKALEIGSEIIALTILAIGTSLPELAVSVAAARKNKTDIILGNIIGSNIFNTFAVMGIPALIKPLKIPADILYFSLPMMLFATVLIIFISIIRRTATLAGVFFVILFLLFLLGVFFDFKMLPT